MTYNNAPAHFVDDKAYWVRRNGDDDALISPVILSVPHAGRDYPQYILNNARLPQNALQKLEDRYADQLVSKAVEAGYCAIIARAPRAWIDLNRDPADIDLSNLTALPRDLRKQILAQQQELPYAMKANAGLGLIPSRLAGYGDIWRTQWHWDDVKARIVNTHAIYHDALSDRLAQRRNIHGCSVLLDVHSMPSLPRGRTNAQPSAQIVFGNRHGASADQSLMDILAHAARSYGLVVEQNTPYAGGYVLSRHADTRRNIQAVQIEFDRALYLDNRGEPASTIGQMQSLLCDMANAAHDYASSCLKVQAAE